MNAHASLPPSPWVRRFAPLIPHGGQVLDLACGHGRHARLLATLGYRVHAVDRNEEALASLAAETGITPLRADLEDGPWPFARASFDGIVVTNYLFRPRLANLLAALKPGGVLIYETFMLGNEIFGKPSNPDFLLQPDELLRVAQNAAQPALDVVAFEQSRIDMPNPAMIQRICARAVPSAGD